MDILEKYHKGEKGWKCPKCGTSLNSDELLLGRCSYCYYQFGGKKLKITSKITPKQKKVKKCITSCRNKHSVTSWKRELCVRICSR